VGSYSITAKATDNLNAVTTSTVVSIVVNPVVSTQSPYGGSPQLIPGVIEAEKYDLGGQGIAYNETTTANQGGAFRTTEAVDVEPYGVGYNVGYIAANEWIEYTVNVTAGTYKIDANVAATAAGKSFRLELDGTTIATFNVPNTGSWTTFQLATATNVVVTEGQKVLRLVATTGDFNVDKVTFTLATTTQNTAPTVSITSPANNASVNAPATLSISATAADADGTVSKVEFYNGTALLFSDDTAPFGYTWSAIGVGTYSLTAKATDNSGASTTSAVVSVTVNTVTTNSCSSIAPYAENNGYVAGSKVKNQNSQYQCKPYPYSGWCNGAAWAYAPGVGAYWSDAWTLLGSCSAARTADNASVNETTVANSPNPFFATTNIEVTALEAGEASVKVYDQTGQLVQTLSEGYLMAGTHQFTFDASTLKAGLYIVKYNSNSGVSSRKIMKAE
jgi:Carbohydrate binding module (family 6)/Bacterial Ig domain/Secretion system C-terminal sorting domain